MRSRSPCTRQDSNTTYTNTPGFLEKKQTNETKMYFFTIGSRSLLLRRSRQAYAYSHVRSNLRFHDLMLATSIVSVDLVYCASVVEYTEWRTVEHNKLSSSSVAQHSLFLIFQNARVSRQSCRAPLLRQVVARLARSKNSHPPRRSHYICWFHHTRIPYPRSIARAPHRHRRCDARLLRRGTSIGLLHRRINLRRASPRRRRTRSEPQPLSRPRGTHATRSRSC